MMESHRLSALCGGKPQAKCLDLAEEKRSVSGIILLSGIITPPEENTPRTLIIKL
jgi:hypothetical protein